MYVHVPLLTASICSLFRQYASSSRDNRSTAFTAISVVLDDILDYIDSGLIVGAEHLVSKSHF